jgi:hypothetical protein
MQHGKQRIAVFATRQTDQPFWGLGWIAVDHAVMLYRFADVLYDPFAQLLELGGFGRTVEQRVYIVGFIKHKRHLRRIERYSKRRLTGIYRLFQDRSQQCCLKRADA